jgi:hypothetical protein
MEAERREQITVKGQAALDRRDDEVDVVQGGAVHVPTVTFRTERALPANMPRD